MFGMELWFVAAILSAIFGGIGAFSIKVAAQRNYNPSAVVFLSSIITLFLIAPTPFLFDGISAFTTEVGVIAFISGLIISVSALLKIPTLNYIDATIFFPLFKVISPFIAIWIGILIFGETFNQLEWFGLILSICVPLLLISRAENTRQNNLKLGLVLMFITSVITVANAGLQKYATGLADAVFWILLFMQIGVVIGSFLLILARRQSSYLADSINRDFLFFISWRAVAITIGMGSGIYAYGNGGPLAIVYTINSLYILIPIVLSIMYYNEHWNTRKAVAIFLSLAAVFLLG